MRLLQLALEALTLQLNEANTSWATRREQAQGLVNAPAVIVVHNQEQEWDANPQNGGVAVLLRRHIMNRPRWGQRVTSFLRSVFVAWDIIGMVGCHTAL